jgi:hypothetical protein
MFSLVKKRTYHARAGGWRTDNKVSWIFRDISLLPDTQKYQVIKDFENFEEVVKYFCNCFLQDTFSRDFDSSTFDLWAIASNKLKAKKEISFSDIKIFPIKAGLNPDTKLISFKLDEASFKDLVNGINFPNPQYTPKVGMSLWIQQISDSLFNSSKLSAPNLPLEQVQVARPPLKVAVEQIRPQEAHGLTSLRAITTFRPEVAVLKNPIPQLNSVETIIQPEFSDKIEYSAPIEPVRVAELPESQKATPSIQFKPAATPTPITPTRVVPSFSTSYSVPANHKKLTNGRKKPWFDWLKLKKLGLLTASIIALIGLGYVADQGLKNLEQKAQKGSPITAQVPQNPTGNTSTSPVINQPADQKTLQSLTEKVISQDERICSELNTFPEQASYSDPQWFRLDSSKFYSCASQQMLAKQNINSRLQRLIEFQDRWLDSNISIDTLLKEALPVQL